MERLAGPKSKVDTAPHGIEKRKVVWTPFERAFVSRLRTVEGITLIGTLNHPNREMRDITTFIDTLDQDQDDQVRESMYKAEEFVLGGIGRLQGRFHCINLSKFSKKDSNAMLEDYVSARDALILLDNRLPTPSPESEPALV